MGWSRLRPAAVGLALAATICGATVGAAPSAIQRSSGAALSAGNGYFTVYVDPSGFVGEYTVTTGPLHPAGNLVNVLFGDGFPNTSFNTIRSYTSGANYVQSAEPLRSHGTVTPLGSNGFRTTYVLAGPPVSPDKLTIVQDVAVYGVTLVDSIVEVKTAVTNNAAGAVAIGIRYLWDYAIGEDDGPTLEEVTPAATATDTEASPSPATAYKVSGNEPTAASSLAVVGIPRARAPDLLQYVCWTKTTVAAFEYAIDPALVVASDEGDCARNGGDSAVLHFFGHDAEHALLIQPGGTVTVAASLTTFGGVPTAVTVRSFTARRTAKGTLLHWRTGSETALLGFNVYRRAGARLVKANRALIPAAGRSTRVHKYSWRDRRAPKTGTLRYRLQAVSPSGARTWRGSAVAS